MAQDTILGSKTLKRGADAVAGTRVGKKDSDYMKRSLKRANDRSAQIADATQRVANKRIMLQRSKRSAKRR